MRRLGRFLCLLCLALAAPGCVAASTHARPISATAAQAPAPSPPAVSSPTATASAVGGINRLALSMLNGLGADADAIVSPYSVGTALAMVDQGASGRSAGQIDALLGEPSPATVAQGYAGVDAALHSAVGARGGPTLHTANALWIQSGLPLLPAFASTLSSDFGAAPRTVGFHADPTAAIGAINGWAATQTDGLIPDLMSPADVSAQTNLVLANAVYLKAAWQTPFDPNDTAPSSFSAPSGRVSVPFMSDSSMDVPYAAAAGYRAVALPYANSSLQFLAVMPTNGTIAGFTRSLTATGLARIAASLAARPLALSMPKFTISFRASLNGLLQSLGVSAAFGPGSQLNRIVSHRTLAIGSVVHQATLEVAEKGTVAAAATGVSLAPTAVAEAQLSLTLNHPFLIFIRDARTGTVLFAARVTDPSAD